MGIETVIMLVKRSLEEEGFKDRVFVYDFNKLNDPANTSLVILSLGRLGSDEIDTFGPNFARGWTIQAQLYQSLQNASGAEAHAALMQDIDKLVLAMEKQFHLGEGSSSDIRQVKVLNISTPTTLSTEKDEVPNWLRSTANVSIEETETVVGQE